MSQGKREYLHSTDEMFFSGLIYTKAEPEQVDIAQNVSF